MKLLHSRNDGFTFIEVMVTLVILSTGIVGLFRSFLICVDYISHLTYRLHAVTLLENRIADIEKKYRQYNDFDFNPGDNEERVIIDHKEVVFKYKMNVVGVDNLQGLNRLDISLLWTEGQDEQQISKSAYFSNIVSFNLI